MTMREHPTAWSQQQEGKEPETHPNVPQHKEQADAKEDKVVADYKPDVDCEPEGLDSEIKPVNDEEEEVSSEFAEMEIPCQRIKQQRSINCKIMA